MAGGRQPRGCPPGDIVVGITQLGAIVIGLLEVVADDLVHLHELCAMSLQPVGEPLVQLPAGCLRQRVVRGIPDQQVAEAVGVLTGELRLVRTDQLLSN